MKIIRENYHLVYQCHRKVEIYRDSGVSKNVNCKNLIISGSYVEKGKERNYKDQNNFIKNLTNFYLSHRLYDFLNTFYPKKEMLFVSYMNIE